MGGDCFQDARRTVARAKRATSNTLFLIFRGRQRRLAVFVGLFHEN